jgi:hypothetical protein
MIASSTYGKSFMYLVRSLERGMGLRSGPMEWCKTLNMGTERLDHAASLMRTTATLKRHVQRPVYHLSISFASTDPVDRTLAEKIGQRTLGDIGLGEHQAVMIGNSDTEHVHLHLIANRVHPESGRAWNPRDAYYRVEKSLRHQERELGLREVPGPRFRFPDQAPAVPRSRSKQHHAPTA